MFNIEKYLDKFTQKIISTEAKNNKILEIIKNETGVSVTLEQMEIKDSVIVLNVSQSVKNKIFTYKENIISKLNSFGFKINSIR